jgi:transposase
MIAPPVGLRIYLACGATDMRKGMAGLAMLVQEGLAQNPYDGSLYAFRGRRGNLVGSVRTRANDPFGRPQRRW